MQATDSPDVHEALSFLTDKNPALARYVSNKRMACGLIHFNSDFGVAPHVPGLNLTQLLSGEKRMRYFRPIVILIAIATLMGFAASAAAKQSQPSVATVEAVEKAPSTSIAQHTDSGLTAEVDTYRIT